MRGVSAVGGKRDLDVVGCDLRSSNFSCGQSITKRNGIRNATNEYGDWAAELMAARASRCPGLRALRALALLLILLPSLASAEEPPAPPVAMPRPAPIDLSLVTRRWQVKQDSDGRFYRVRLAPTAKPAMWAPGLALWAGSYLAGGFAALPASDGTRELAWLPFAGPVVNAFIATTTAGQILWPLDSAAQVAGCVLFVVGLEAGPLTLQRRPLNVGPIGFIGGGSGVALSGKF
jgi:hypothetical protein